VPPDRFRPMVKWWDEVPALLAMILVEGAAERCWI
jgi:hypothetical protein